VLSYVAVFADREGLGNPGLFFLPYSVTLVFVRLLAGRISDRYGRVTVLFPALIALIAALVVIATAEQVLVLLLGAVLLGIGFGTAHPTILAMVVDRAPAGRQGASMSTLIGSFDLGIGGGSMVAGVLVATAGLRGIFLLACCAPMLGLLLLAASIQRKHYR
jgi:MFS family permease